jgi:hypothetical protein
MLRSGSKALEQNTLQGLSTSGLDISLAASEAWTEDRARSRGEPRRPATSQGLAAQPGGSWANGGGGGECAGDHPPELCCPDCGATGDGIMTMEVADPDAMPKGKASMTTFSLTRDQLIKQGQLRSGAQTPQARPLPFSAIDIVPSVQYILAYRS